MASRKGRGLSRGLSVRSRPPPSASSASGSHRTRTGASGSDRHLQHHHHHRSPGTDVERFGGEGLMGRTKLKNCCRSVATFMCTQVGVGGVIVGYAICGAFMFIALERDGNPYADKDYHDLIDKRRNYVDDLFINYTASHWNETEWQDAANYTLHKLQGDVVKAVENGYDGRKIDEKWNFPAALMFTLSIFTMIGYGNLVPRTDWGKVVTILYAVIGIPLYVLYFLNMGRALARAFKWSYIKLSSCTLGSRNSASSIDTDSGEGVVMMAGEQMRGSQKIDSVVVPSAASIYVLISYIAVGTIMFAEWEGWEYLNSVYFCVISLCKIGLGDFVPGTSIDGNSEGNQIKLMINFVYLLLGLGLVAMCYNLLREEVLAKLKQMKADVNDIFHVFSQAYLSECQPKQSIRLFERHDLFCILIGWKLSSPRQPMAVSSSEASKPPEFVSTTNKMDDEAELEPLILSGTQTDKRLQEADTTLGMTCVGSETVNTEVTPSACAQKVKRYMLVLGDDGKTNDVIYASPLKKEYLGNDVESSTSDHDKHRVIVYFGGDIQDFQEAMDISIQQREHKKWNLDNTASILQNQFPDHHILVVRPKRQQDRTFSCFDNFLPTGHLGNPEHTPYHGALLHLRSLLIELSRRINKDHVDTLPTKTEKDISSTSVTRGKELTEKLIPVNLEAAEISLVGFSKGCVVLNQLLYEFHYLKTLTPDDKSFEDFLRCLRDMYWLDGGHSGGKNTWIVARSLLETLSRLKINVHVHVTPYQICDDLRPIIRREEKLFSDSLKNSGASIQRYVHFENLPPSLTNHFQLLAEFGSPTTANTYENDDWESEQNCRMLPENVYYHLDDLIPNTDYNDNEEDEEQN